MDPSVKSEVSTLVVKPALVGASAYGIAAFMYPSVQTNVLGVNMSNRAGIGVSAAAGQLVGDLVQKHVLPHITRDPRVLNEDSRIMKTLLTAGGTAAVGLLSGAPMNELPQLAAIGGASDLIGNYVEDNIVRPNTGF